jgi:hypothetical protein
VAVFLLEGILKNASYAQWLRCDSDKFDTGPQGSATVPTVFWVISVTIHEFIGDGKKCGVGDWNIRSAIPIVNQLVLQERRETQ